MPSKRRPAHSRDRHSRPGAPCPSAVDAVEQYLLTWLESEPEPTRAPTAGRPPEVPAMLLWVSLLVCILRGFSSQLDVWRRITACGLWRYPRVEVSDMAIYQRFARTSPAALAEFFVSLSAALAAHLEGRCAVAGASFAAGIYALDQTVLDPVSAKLKLLRGLRKGDHRRLPGVLGCVFDVRRQLWTKVEFSPDALRNEKPTAPGLVAGLPRGALLLFDLGYFSFPWLDYLIDAGFDFVCRLPAKVTYVEQHVLCEVQTARVRLRETLVYLGAGPEAQHSRAAFPLRLLAITRRVRAGVDSPGDRTWYYLTSVLDPRQLPASEAVGLYGRRWDIETAFGLCKTHLKLHLVWSAQQNALLHQVYATLLLAQVVSALRFVIADAAGADVREVSLELLLRWLPEFAAEGQDPIAMFVREGRRLGFIRPFRGAEREVPAPQASDYQLPPEWPPQRVARYHRFKEDSVQKILQARLNADLPLPTEEKND